MRLSICSPCGGYGNHLRWLLLYGHEIYSKKNKFEGYTSKKFLEFIKTSIYNDERTCFNWLNIEWKYRLKLKPYIDFNHRIEAVFNKSQHNKIIVMTMEPDNALKAYLKFNPLLNRSTVESFKEQINTQNEMNTKFIVSKNDSVLYTRSEDLYKPILDKEFYDKIIDFFNFSNMYDLANAIHGLWYKLHQRAEKDILNIKNGWYYTDNIDKPDESNINQVVKLIYNIYGD